MRAAGATPGPARHVGRVTMLVLVAVATASGAPRWPTATATTCGAFDVVFAEPTAWRCIDRGRCTICRYLGADPTHLTTVCTESGERRVGEVPAGAELSICRPQMAALPRTDRHPHGGARAASVVADGTAKEDARCVG